MDIFKQIADSIQDGLYSIFTDWDLVLWQLLATIILIIAVKVFLWKPITKFLEARNEALSKELTEANYEREKARQIRVETQNEYDGIKKEIKDFKQSLMTEAQTEKERIISEARAEAKRRIIQVERDIQHELRLQEEKIKSSIKEIAFQVAEKLVSHEVEEDEVDEVINNLVDKQI